PPPVVCNVAEKRSGPATRPNEDGAGARVLEDVRQLLPAVAGVDRNVDRSQPVVPQQGDDDLRRGLGENGHSVALFPSGGRETAGITARQEIEIPEGPGSSLELESDLFCPVLQIAEEARDAALRVSAHRGPI